MERLHNILRCLALASVTVAGAFACILMLQAGNALQRLGEGANGTLGLLNTDAEQLGTTLTALNAPCKDDQGSVTCGPIPQLAQTEKNIGIVAAQGAEQVKQSGRLISQASDAIVAVTGTAQGALGTAQEQLTHVAPLLDAAKGSADAAKTTLDGLVLTETASTKAVADFDARLNDPQIPKIEGNVAAMTGSWAGISGDAQTKFHTLLYPDPCHRFACHFGQVVNDVRLGAQFVQPAFYLKEILTGQQISGSITVTPAPKAVR